MVTVVSFIGFSLPVQVAGMKMAAPIGAAWPAVAAARYR